MSNIEFGEDGRPIPRTVVKRIPRPGTQFKRILLKYVSGHATELGKYVALDTHSGGYPYATDILSAHDFKTKEDALNYRGRADAKKLSVVEVTLNVEEKLMVDVEKDRYQVKEDPLQCGWQVRDTGDGGDGDQLMAIFYGRIGGKALAEDFAKTLNAK